MCMKAWVRKNKPTVAARGIVCYIVGGRGACLHVKAPKLGLDRQNEVLTPYSLLPAHQSHLKLRGGGAGGRRRRMLHFLLYSVVNRLDPFCTHVCMSPLLSTGHAAHLEEESGRSLTPR